MKEEKRGRKDIRGEKKLASLTCRVFTKRDLKKGIYRFMGQIGGTYNVI